MMASPWLPLTISYVFDWIIVILVAGGGGILYYITGFHRPFSLTDIHIAYPDKADIVSLPVLVIVALILPAGIIFVLCLASRFLGITNYNPFRRVFLAILWEIHAGIIGLCASLAGTLFITTGLKNMVGKPRPNLLARCNADLTKISGFTVGGYGNTIDSESAVLVSSGICRQADKHLLDDGFAAFPSGHSSFACAGLVYLSLWLCARFALTIPYLDYGRNPPTSKHSGGQEQSAPPLWQIVAALVPTVVALFICSSRYADFHHAGFDIICGALLGTVFAFSAFRLYHLPMRRSRGRLAWGERAGRHAFFSSPNKYEDATDVDTRNGIDESYELRDAEAATLPTRVDTHNSQRPMLYEPYTGR